MAPPTDPQSDDVTGLGPAPAEPVTDLFGNKTTGKRRHNPPPVTQAQWTFAYYVVYGNSLERAYQLAYPKSTKDRSRSATTRRARRLLELDQVQAEIEKMRREIRYSEGYTPEQHMNRLTELGDLALDKGDIKTAVLAEVNKGKAAGFYVERHEHSITRPTDPVEILERITALAERRPEVLTALAERHPHMLELLTQRTQAAATRERLEPVDHAAAAPNPDDETPTPPPS